MVCGIRETNVLQSTATCITCGPCITRIIGSALLSLKTPPTFIPGVKSSRHSESINRQPSNDLKFNRQPSQTAFILTVKGSLPPET